MTVAQAGEAMRLSPAAQESLRCPRCSGALRLESAQATCTQSDCAHRYLIEDGVAILLDEEKSLFTAEQVLRERRMPSSRASSPLLRGLASLIPSLGRSYKTEANMQKFAQLLTGARPRVLVVGGGVLGEGCELLLANGALELVETDVFLGPRTSLVCDAHALPFADGFFDGAIVQAVLEHVVDPVRCVAELHRVLKPDGAIYAETPFMQQVHMGRHDFTRFTHLGHRRLCRRFTEIASGACGGTGMALAWAWQAFLLSPVRSRFAQAFVRAFAGFSSWPLKWVDAWMIDRPGTLDGASALYFLGRKSDATLADRALIAGYRGAQQ